MKIHIVKNWIKKFGTNQNDPAETIPIGPSPELCGCGGLIITDGCEFCEECIDGYRGEDEK